METTLHLRFEMLQQIAAVAESRGISRSELIVLLIAQIARDIDNPGQLGRRVQYQSRQKSADWRIFHVQLREDTYEYWLDLRKLMKMSVSLILAFAFKKFMRKPIKFNTTDNYLLRNYFIIKEIIDSTIIWKFIWGWPPNLKKCNSS